MGEYMIKIFEIIVGVIVGIFSFIVGLNEETSIILGILFTLVFTTLYEFGRLVKTVKDWEFTLRELKNSILKSLEDTQIVLFLLRYGVIEIPREEFTRAWVDILWNIRKEYLATHYVSLEETWGQEEGYTKLGLEIQKVKAEQGMKIQRIFIVNNSNELEQLKKVMIQQHKMGIKVGYIFIEEVFQKYPLSDLAKRIESLDFAIIDEKIGLLVRYDENRSVRGIRIIFGQDKIKNYQDFYTELNQYVKRDFLKMEVSHGKRAFNHKNIDPDASGGWHINRCH